MTGSNNIIIQPRDLKLLRTTALLRAIDREQARAIGGFRSTTRVNATMLRLVKAGLLNRFFLGVGPGTQKSIYTISRKGAALSGAAYRRFRRKNNGLYSGDIFLEHQLLLNEIYISLCKPGSQAGLQNWKTFEKPLPNSALIPDAYFELVKGELIKPVFLEVDRSTESKKIWKKKIASYLSFALSEAFPKHFGQTQFRVAVIATTEAQLRRIQSVIAGQTSKVFWLTTFSDIKTWGFLSAIWHRPSGDDKHPFL
jgi:hypothetical protein